MSALEHETGHYTFLIGVKGVDVSEASPYENRFFEAGCDDALILVVDGELQLDFQREAPSYEMAVQSAVAEIERAGGQIRYIERTDQR